MINQVAGQSAFLDNVIVFFADYLAYILVAVFLGLFLYKNISRSEKISLFVSAVIGIILGRGIIVETIRYFYHHLRPFVDFPQIHPLLSESSYSFPSGHATFFFTLSAVVYHYDKKTGIVFFVFSAIMGLARIAAGVHYPFDILGGAFIGALIGFGCSLAVRTYFGNAEKNTGA